MEDDVALDIEAIGKDPQLLDERNFYSRLEAIDYIEFNIIDRINAVIKGIDVSDLLSSLKQDARKLQCLLEQVNAKMFHNLRTKLSLASDKEKLLKNLVKEYLDYNLDAFSSQDTLGYDDLDMFLNGVLTHRAMPVETLDLEPEMVSYQKTPARVIVDLINRAALKPHDVFFDVGSGLGDVSILVNLLTSAKSIGIEFEPAFCDYAAVRAAYLNLKHIEFANIDARYADYSTGTVFFMYTPFKGKMLQDVLDNLNGEAKKRQIKIFTYGSCTYEVAKQNWLVNASEAQYGSDRLVEFLSIL